MLSYSSGMARTCQSANDRWMLIKGQRPEDGDGIPAMDPSPTSTRKCRTQPIPAKTLSQLVRKSNALSPKSMIYLLAMEHEVPSQFNSEQRGTPNQQTFHMKLSLGEEEYAASGAGADEVEHLAAMKALEQTQLRLPSQILASTVQQMAWLRGLEAEFEVFERKHPGATVFIASCACGVLASKGVAHDMKTSLAMCAEEMREKLRAIPQREDLCSVVLAKEMGRSHVSKGKLDLTQELGNEEDVQSTQQREKMPSEGPLSGTSLSK